MLNASFLLVNLALKARANEAELRQHACALTMAANAAKQNAEALEALICHGTSDQIAAAVTALVDIDKKESEGRLGT